MSSIPLNKRVAREEFVQLDRTFHALPDYASKADDVDLAESGRVGRPLTWPNLLRSQRVVVLAEAGAGKTFELLNKARELRERGEAAFFIRLEHVRDDLRLAFEVGTHASFLDWISGQDEAWVFLDSVEEARLRGPADFELAVKKIADAIGGASIRARIYISGRIGAWRPWTDLQHCMVNFPCIPQSKLQVESKPVQEEPVAETPTLPWETKDTVPTGPTPEGAKEDEFQLVTLDDLTPHQIARFATARGVPDPPAMLAAIDAVDGWAFAARPQDLEDLVQAWREEGRIGNRLESHRRSIERRLLERDSVRAESRPLADDRVRKGVELLAAAATLTKVSIIRVPDGAEATPGISTQSILPNWTESDRSTLLMRPVFDEAIYGSVRFHHRRAREYLTAEWLAGLLKQNTSRRAVEDLMLRSQYGLDVVVPTMRAIVPWVALKDERVRERVVRAAPDILLEGGDPTCLPLNSREALLSAFCDQIATKSEQRVVRDINVLRRFSGADLGPQIIALITEYEGNEDVVAFLLRVAWAGQIEALLPIAKSFAVDVGRHRYTRMAASRVIGAAGSEEDGRALRRALLMETPSITHDWAAELLDRAPATQDTLDWLFGIALEPEPKKRSGSNELGASAAVFLSRCPLELLPHAAARLNTLLAAHSIDEGYRWRIPSKHLWMLALASAIASRLIQFRQPAALEPACLGLLAKLASGNRFDQTEFFEPPLNYTNAVRGWDELNKAAFWFSVAESRARAERGAEGRVTTHGSASAFGGYWGFGIEHFEYFAEQIQKQELQDNKLVALAVAFGLYLDGGRPRKWRQQLKRGVAENLELVSTLGRYYRPPPAPERRRWKEMERRNEQRRLASLAEDAANRAEWKQHLIANLESLRSANKLNPGDFTKELIHLFQRSHERKDSNNRWTAYNWKLLVPDFGQPVAAFYRDAAVSFWKHFEPKLVSEGAPRNTTPYRNIFGLAGIEIEAHETPGWPSGLSREEVRLACRYAAWELNGFPTWFPKLFETFPDEVASFLLQEIRWELDASASTKDPSYILSDVAWTGRWCWDRLAPALLDQLRSRDRMVWQHLDAALNIVQGSNVLDKSIQEVASQRVAACEDMDTLARWLAVWVGVSPAEGLAELERLLARYDTAGQRSALAMRFIVNVQGRRRNHTGSARRAYIEPSILGRLYLLMHEHIRRDADIDRADGGVYTPELRDDAQDARDALLSALCEIPGAEAFSALRTVVDAFPDRPWLGRLLRDRAEADADLDAWKPEDVRDFDQSQLQMPRNHSQLARLVEQRILDLKDELELGDTSLAGILISLNEETKLRQFIGRELREKAGNRYNAVQEEELAGGRGGVKPDIRVHGHGFDAPVPVELKFADSWSGPHLVERLENQLCKNYLSDPRSTRGLFIVVTRGRQMNWDLPDGKRVNFDGLVSGLQDHWRDLSHAYPGIENVAVIGIDLTSNRNRSSEH